MEKMGTHPQSPTQSTEPALSNTLSHICTATQAQLLSHLHTGPELCTHTQACACPCGDGWGAVGGCVVGGGSCLMLSAYTHTQENTRSQVLSLGMSVLQDLGPEGSQAGESGRL